MTVLRRLSLLAATAALLAGCATPPVLSVPTRAAAPPPTALVQALGERPPAVSAAGADEAAAIEALLPDTPVDVALPPQPAPQFIDAVLGQVLGLPYSLGPNVAARREIVALSSGGPISRRALLRIVQTTLRDYGLRLRVADGAVSVVEDAAPPSRIAAVLRGRASAQTPEGLRTVVVAEPLKVLAAEDLASLLRALPPEGAGVELRAQAEGNVLVFSGPVGEAGPILDLARRLDQPAFAGAQAIQLSPAFLQPQAFARALDAAAAAEAEAAAAPGARALLILPLTSRGQVLVFVRGEEQAQAVRRWALAADRPAEPAEGPATFVYRTRNLEAQALGSLISTTIATPKSELRVPVGVPGAPPLTGEAMPPESAGAPAGSVATGGAIVVDTIGNRLIFTGTAAEYARLRPVLEALDAAPGQVMVEVVVAEVTLTDTTRVGLEWFFSQSQSNGVLSGGTLGGLGLAAGGLQLKFHGPDLRAAFNAFASNNNVNILSRPKLVTRSGSEAQIQVGADVPIITSQTAANVQSGGDTDVLQTVQYRQTGVILKIKPVVYAGERIDLEISQEVSSQQPNDNAAISSPLFLNRSASTTLSLIDGSTAVIGGLMDDNFTKGNTGVPFVKDVPLLGAAFRADTANGKKTELVILVTPFIVREPGELAAAAREMAEGADRAFVGGLRAYTLSPWRLEFSGARGPAASPPDRR